MEILTMLSRARHDLKVTRFAVKSGPGATKAGECSCRRQEDSFVTDAIAFSSQYHETK